MSTHDEPNQADPWRTASDAGPIPAVEPVLAAAPSNPSTIGRYRVLRILGEGGFGRVYLAHDDELDRPVAIKVPHRERISRPQDVQKYLAEARILASLDHPGIVPVHDVGRTDDGLCYVVSKYIEGSDLTRVIKENPLSHLRSAELVATVAEALQYSHIRGLVHRDIKPGNILFDTAGKPHVTDFGLALKDGDFGRGARFAGTPAYMSPEQARGEGHRVDGRSDIFSLGVVFYELLTGRRPFRGEDPQELLDQIATMEVRPPRQVDETIPKELERICLKAMAKRASERYTTAKDFAEDLRFFVKTASGTESPAPLTPGVIPSAGTPHATPTPVTSDSPGADQRPIKIVPKGLRSFDAHYADFFLELLPGPRNREGLPESLRFWKSKIEEIDADRTFRVGLIYGPSGCGKSSLVKAGLLPRLAGHVRAVYVEATPDDTEHRLLKGLRKHCPGLTPDLVLVESLATLRRGRALPTGQKVLIVLDQFEQWLHGKVGVEETELVTALRQCDGERVQAVVLVRDDFWMAASRFMKGLEVRLVEAENSALVDLFDPRHARKVLTAFGQAFGALPEDDGHLTSEQQAFLEQAVNGLTQDGKVISVRLALFAQMVKGRPWTPATLRQVGGAEGVGVTFLEETFSATTAPPEHRLHQNAARSVLKTLLPESGMEIRGHMRSHQELLEASGYSTRPGEFAELMRILDGELRLLTPTDPEGAGDEGGPQPKAPGERYYQLTHDYLVPTLRNWLTRKQRETWRGWAELLFLERYTLWKVKEEARYLPSAVEWLLIVLLTNKKRWTRHKIKMIFLKLVYTILYLISLPIIIIMCLLIFGGFVNSIISFGPNNDKAYAIVTGLAVFVFIVWPALIAYRRSNI